MYAGIVRDKERMQKKRQEYMDRVNEGVAPSVMNPTEENQLASRK